MTFSIITVCFNCVDTIEKTIKSVLDQDNHDYEYIIIDGNSTDGTVEIIKKYESRIHYWISENDNGIYDAMNKGINKASGEYVSFLNSGDYYEKSELNNVTKSIEISDRADIVYGNIYYLVSGNKHIYSKFDINDLNKIIYGMNIGHPSSFCKRYLFDEIGIFNTDYKIAADYEWFLRVYLEKGSASFYHSDLFATFFSQDGLSNTNYLLSQYEARNISLSYAKEYGFSSHIINKIDKTIKDNICSAIIQRFEWPWKEVGKTFWAKEKKAWIFGSGKNYVRCKNIIKYMGGSVVGVMDNDEKKWEKCIDGDRIYMPFAGIVRDDIVIISSEKYSDDILVQLKNKGFILKNIFSITYLKKDAIQIVLKKLHEVHFFDKEFERIIRNNESSLGLQYYSS